LAHCCDESTRPGSAIILDVFGSLAPSKFAKSGNNAGLPFGLMNGALTLKKRPLGGQALPSSAHSVKICGEFKFIV
jgi:hypothetical protein